jgi:hypothetical protein
MNACKCMHYSAMQQQTFAVVTTSKNRYALNALNLIFAIKLIHFLIHIVNIGIRLRMHV